MDLAMTKILPPWFDYLEQSFSFNEFNFKSFPCPEKISCPPAGPKVNETTARILVIQSYIHTVLKVAEHSFQVPMPNSP